MDNKNQTQVKDKLIRVSHTIGLELETQLLKMKKAGKKETEKQFTENAIIERIAKIKKN